MQPLGPPAGVVAEPPYRRDVLDSFRAIGSMLHLDFAARPRLLDRFFCPGDSQPILRDPWAAVS